MTNILNFDSDVPASTPSVELSPPSASMLAGGLAVEDWLSRDVGHLAESTPANQAASVGLMLRLWLPQMPGQPLQAKADALGHPVKIGNEWATALTDEQILAIESEAVQSAQEIIELIEGLPQILIRHPDSAGVVALSLLTQRDDIQSVIRVLRVLGDTGYLKRAAAEIDRAASAQLTAINECLRHVSPQEDVRRLWAAASQEPHHWWGVCAMNNMMKSQETK
tara:strand:+ start:1407 stop:2075 length:669 start_codon:yes stop_codon:yes gene_type:complete